jgi:hypothetical protein
MPPLVSNDSFSRDRPSPDRSGECGDTQAQRNGGARLTHASAVRVRVLLDDRCRFDGVDRKVGVRQLCSPTAPAKRFAPPDPERCDAQHRREQTCHRAISLARLIASAHASSPSVCSPSTAQSTATSSAGKPRRDTSSPRRGGHFAKRHSARLFGLLTRWVSGCSSAALMTPTSCSQQWGASARQGRLPSTPSWPTRHRAQGVLSAAGRAVFRRAELCLRAELAWHEACPAVLGGAATGEAGTGRNKQ